MKIGQIGQIGQIKAYLRKVPKKTITRDLYENGTLSVHLSNIKSIPSLYFVGEEKESP